MQTERGTERHTETHRKNESLSVSSYNDFSVQAQESGGEWRMVGSQFSDAKTLTNRQQKNFEQSMPISSILDHLLSFFATFYALSPAGFRII